MSAWTIWKYDLPTDTDRFEVPSIPGYHLTVQVQRGKPVLWCYVMPSLLDDIPQHERSPVSFVWVGTGRPIPDDVRSIGSDYVGTVQLYDGDLVLHLFRLHK